MKLGAFVELSMTTLAITACGGPPAPSETAAPWGTATTVQELSIGVESGADEYMFGSIRGIAVGVDGTIFVNDRQVGLRSYDANGRFLRNVGQQGQGPGEYTDLRGLRVLPDGRIVTLDLGNSRVTLWSETGEYLDGFGTAALAFEPGAARSVLFATLYGPAQDLEVDVHGNIYLQTVDDLSRMASTDNPPQAVYLRVTDVGTSRGTVPIPLPEQAPANSFAVAIPGGVLRNFPTVTLSAWNPLGFLMVGRNDVYDIELRKPEGTIHLVREIEPPLLVADERAEWDALTAYYNQRSRERGSDVRFEPVAAAKPYFRQIFAGIDGRVWVLRYVEAERVEVPNPRSDDVPHP